MSSRPKYTSHTHIHTQTEHINTYLTWTHGQQPQSSQSFQWHENKQHQWAQPFTLTFTSSTGFSSHLLPFQLLAAQTPINARIYERPLLGNSRKQRSALLVLVPHTHRTKNPHPGDGEFNIKEFNGKTGQMSLMRHGA